MTDFQNLATITANNGGVSLRASRLGRIRLRLAVILGGF